MSFFDQSHAAKRGFIFGTLALISLHAVPVAAENYEVSLTRKGSNVYQVRGKDIIIQTRYCYVYAYSEEAILKASGYGGEVIFFDSKDKCDVKAVFGLSSQAPGNYGVTVSREDDDWYEVFGTGMYIRTSLCLSLALADDAYLTLSPYGNGELLFADGDSCTVEGVYEKLRL